MITIERQYNANYRIYDDYSAMNGDLTFWAKVESEHEVLSLAYQEIRRLHTTFECGIIHVFYLGPAGGKRSDLYIE